MNNDEREWALEVLETICKSAVSMSVSLLIFLLFVHFNEPPQQTIELRVIVLSEVCQ